MTNTRFLHLGARERRWILFLSTWVAGLIFGVILAYQASEAYLLWMRRAAYTPVSIIGLLASVGLPFLLVCFSVYISKPGLIYWICLIKACSFSVTALSIASAFGSAGWLVRPLLQFSDTLSLPVLCWFSMRHLDGNRESLRNDVAACSLFLICLGWIEMYSVSPFLAALMENTQTGR